MLGDMAAARTFDDKRARLHQLSAMPANEAQAELKKLLTDRNGYLVGEAAEVVKKLEISALVPDLAAAFSRLAPEGAKSDKGCFGKNRLVEALLYFDAYEAEVYLTGLRLEQLEPAFGKPIDTASGLRGLCAHALFHIRHPKALLEVAPLLFDAEPIARAEAASALGDSGLDGAAAALHVKVLAGDKEADVMGSVYKALLRIAPDRYLKLVTSALSSEEEGVFEAAALALGESRVSGAFEALKGAAQRGHLFRGSDSVLLGIALLRTDEAIAYLETLVERAHDTQAESALSALALHRHDEALVRRLKEKVAARKSKKLAETLRDKFER